MEQAVNQFNKGLQSDTHPMVQGNDTLSDALNATFVTMNGNEVVLQNDMGNRRVDNAYLPSGYEPVGMKEYGGIIYVAAYNPITNKSQLGSFPSPERKISSEDGSGLGGKLELDQLLQSYNDANLNGLKCIYKDTILVPLTKDTSLHAGDKFVVYGTLTDTGDISNYHNTTGTKVTSPKNKKYTLALGILNSQNEFVDITKTLTRWNEGTMIDYTDQNVSDLFKFNDGYFIASSFENPTFDETLSDAQLIIERQTIATNTYAYKLVGPLYVKATLNHIRDFNYNIYGISSNDEKTKGEIWIEAFVTYNCPDGLTSGDGSDDNYSTYAEGELSFPVFDLKDVSGTSSLKGVVSSEETKYDPNTDLYTYKIVKHYDITAGSGTIYQYAIGVQAVNGEELYLSGLSTKGEIDISLLGSGKVKLKGWRFICDYANQASTITYNFDAYPKYGESFQNFKFIVTDSKDSNDSREIPANLYNGRNNLNIDWKTYGLLPNKLYKITWEYDIVGGDHPGTYTSKDLTNPDGTAKSDEQKKYQADRWLLTTELFNDCYNPNSGDYIQDFGKPQGEKIQSNPQSEAYIFNRKEQVPYTFNPNTSDKTSDPKITTDGQIIKKTSDIKLIYTTTRNVVLLLNPSIEFNNELYPDYVLVKSDATNNVQIQNITYKCDGKMDYSNKIGYTNEDPKIYEPKFELKTPTGKIKTIAGVLTNFDFYESEGVSDGTIKNGFISFYKFLDDEIMEMKPDSTRTFNMTCVDWHDSAKDDGHYVNVMIDSPREFMNISGSDGGTTEYQHRIDSRENDDIEIFTTEALSSAIQNQFSAIKSQQIFTWGYAANTGNFWISSSQDRNTGQEQNQYARVWWRNSYGTWSLFPKKKSRRDSIATFIKSCISTNFKFAYYKSTTFADAKVFGPNSSKYRQSSEYNFPFNINWDMKIESQDVFDIDNPEDIKCDYPIFRVNGDQVEQNYTHIFNVKNSEDFSDMMNIIPNLNDVDGIDIETGRIVDNKGASLNSNNFYITNSSNELEYWSNTEIALSEKYGDSAQGKRTIIYNQDTTGQPWDAYDVCGSDGDSHTVLFYNKINIVKL